MGKYSDYTVYLKGTTTYHNLQTAYSYLNKLGKSIDELDKSLDGASGETIKNMRQEIRDVGSTVLSMKGSVKNIIGVLEHNASLFDATLCALEELLKDKQIIFQRYTFKKMYEVGDGHGEKYGTLNCVRRNSSTGQIDAVYDVYVREKGPRDAWWMYSRKTGQTIQQYTVKGKTITTIS